MHSTIIAGLALAAFAVPGGPAAAYAAQAPQREPLQQPAAAASRQAEDAAFLRGTPPPQEGYQDDYQDDSRYQDGYRDQDGYASAQRGPGVRVWLDNDRDVFRAGDRTRVLLRPATDAFVAVVHINPRGDVEFLWPRSYQDDGFVAGGRTLSLGMRSGSYLNVGSVQGIGYVFAVASDEPLDVQGVRDYYYRRNVGFDPDLNVYGDPFYAMEGFERLLVPDWEYGYHSSDYYSYHVGSRYQYPRYACYSGFGAWYAGVGVYVDSCDRIRVLLRSRPHYYDTRYYRGDRSRYYRSWYRYDDRRYVHRRYVDRRYVDRRSREPSHRYKEDTDERGSAAGRPSTQRPGLRSGDGPPQRAGSTAAARGREQERQDGSGARAAPPTRQRPTLQRRPPESEPARREPEERRAPPARREEPRREEPRVRESPPARGSEPRSREAPPARAEPRREEPRARSSEPRSREAPPARAEPRREEPRREAPPSRSADPPRRDPPPSRGDSDGGRSAPSERSAPRVRPS